MRINITIDCSRFSPDSFGTEISVIAEQLQRQAAQKRRDEFIELTSPVIRDSRGSPVGRIWAEGTMGAAND